MNIVEQVRNIKHHSSNVSESDPFTMLEEELSSALSLYWSTADRILRGSGVNLLDSPDDFFALERNFFSAIFLYSYHRASIPRPRRIFYAAVNQCLRGMVTGCDNILDDEYKKTLETDLPVQGIRFRSVLDIMVSDRVLFEIILESCRSNDLTFEQAAAISSASLRALAKSGAQEASEERGVDNILEPAEVLRSVHHYKTGILFQCPWAVPSVLEGRESKIVSHLLNALYRIGMGCQIMDDMVDLLADAKNKRHNYVRSLIYHDSDKSERAWLEALLESNLRPKEKPIVLFEFPRAKKAATRTARNFLENGLSALLADRHQFMVEPTILFLSKRIGTDRFMSDCER